MGEDLEESGCGVGLLSQHAKAEENNEKYFSEESISSADIRT
jgi:hypothetical protein